MIIRYGSRKLEKQFSNATEIRKAFGVMANKVGQRIAEISASPNIQILMQIPAANCHQLTGNRNTEWAVSISGNHRIIFEITHNPIPLKEDSGVDTLRVTDITIIKTEDYH